MTTRRTLVTAAAPIVLGLAVVAMLVVTWRAQERATDATDAIARYRQANTELARTQRTLSASVAHLSDLLDQRQSIAAHAQCVEDRLLRTVPPLTSLVTDPDNLDARRRFLAAVAALEAGIDRDCPPLPAGR